MTKINHVSRSPNDMNNAPQTMEQKVAGLMSDQTYTDTQKLTMLSRLLSHSTTVEERGIVLLALTQSMMEVSREVKRVNRTFSSIKQLVDTHSELIQDMSAENWEVLGGFLEAFLRCSNLAKADKSFNDKSRSFKS
ncbi:MULTISPECIES: hypothetical protein [Vibrio]|uniref:hypothetical protein n=1 Tax=Vibrio TaxID=662 RepID=UPI0001B953E7|nr:MULTISPECIES: hypothetical protein [Vibrio]EEX34248.1 hypothetical protein VIC_001042 [Vibrio coralliilyticus ATCC BAA-450]MDE3898658.1 hypothetical protein [Vibrio sp. CC007]